METSRARRQDQGLKSKTGLHPTNTQSSRALTARVGRQVLGNVLSYNKKEYQHHDEVETRNYLSPRSIFFDLGGMQRGRSSVVNANESMYLTTSSTLSISCGSERFIVARRNNHIHAAL